MIVLRSAQNTTIQKTIYNYVQEWGECETARQYTFLGERRLNVLNKIYYLGLTFTLITVTPVLRSER